MRPRPVSGRLTLAVSAATLLIAALAGCDYFRPARPEIPVGGGVVGRFTAPETTLVTLQLAVIDKSATNGQSVYTACFADTSVDAIAFHAFFDPVTAARFPNSDLSWDIAREQIFYANLSRVQAGSKFIFSWTDHPEAGNDVIEPASAILHRAYLIQATPDDILYVPVAKGFADIYLVLSGGSWKIYRWQDFEDPNADFNTGEVSYGQLRLSGPQ